MKKSFAVLYTCFNRKDKTLKALNSLYKAFEQFDGGWTMHIYLTDDGSTDGTSVAVAKQFPDVNILSGNGSMYWAGGMRNSWNKAKDGNYDAYLLLNDDTELKSDLFLKIFRTDDYSIEKNGVSGIYIGVTIDSVTKQQTYGGLVFSNRFLGTARRLPIGDSPQRCELGNANIMWVSKNVMEKIGILAKGYVHGMADYDYSMNASDKGLPVYAMSGVSGICDNDHGNTYEKFIGLSFSKRLKFLYHPVGLDFKSQVYHMKKNFPLRLPVFLAMGYFKVLFPKFYYNWIYTTRTDDRN